MNSKKKTKHKYVQPISSEEFLMSTRRLPQYDECLKEFIESEDEICRVNIAALPSKNSRVVLSSLKWRIKTKPAFKNIRIFLRKGNIYLEKVKNNE